jgi:hypothetical protein
VPSSTVHEVKSTSEMTKNNKMYFICSSSDIS